MLSIDFCPLPALSPAKKATANALILLVSEGKKLGSYAAAVDKKTGGQITRALAASPRFTGKRGQVLALPAPQDVPFSRVILAATGDAKSFDREAVETIATSVLPALNAAGITHATLAAELPKTGAALATAAAQMAFAAVLRSYRFGKYFTKKKPEELPSLTSLSIALAAPAPAAKAFEEMRPLMEAMLFTRDLVSEPANIIHPESLAAACQSLTKFGLKVEVLGEAEMKKLGMGALLGVGQGSEKESKLVVMEWKGKAKKAAKPVAFVGKGVTFDTGGISIKPAGGMEEMKWDMGGSAAVIGLMRTLAARKAPVHAVGVVGLVENMPDGNAQRPGDVVTSMSGQTIEVLNTDAEGRLVLADALWYTQNRFKPQAVVDLATLTGAIIVALGTSRAGLFSNNDTLATRLQKSAEATGEALWRLPLAEVYDKQINSDIADMQNIGKEREAGSITAAQFLQRFIQDGVAWAHLDIAGTAWTNKDLTVAPKGATAFGVRLLDELVREYYE